MLAPWTGHYFDLPSFLNASYSVGSGFVPYLPHELGGYVKGAPPFYWDTPWTGYPPPWPTWLGISYLVGHWNLYVHILLIKLPIILGDLLLIWLIHGIVRKYSGEDRALSAARAYSLLPPAIFIGSVWGMPDALGSLFLLLSFLTLGRNVARSAILNALSISIKLLPIVQSPVIVMESFVRRGPRMGALYLALIALSLLLMIVLPFAVVVEPKALLQLIVPSLYTTYAQRATEVSSGFSYFAAYAILSREALALDPWIPAVVAITLLYVVWLTKMKTRADGCIYAMLALIGLTAILLLGRSNPQYFMVAYPFMVIFSYLTRRQVVRRLFHASWASWFVAVSVQQNPIRFLNPILPNYVGTVRDFHSHWFGRPDSPFVSERDFFWLIHSPYTSWILPVTLIAFLLLSTLYVVVVLRTVMSSRH